MNPIEASTVLVCFAVPEEAAPFRKRVLPHKIPRLEVLVTGMGAHNARRGILERLQTGGRPPPAMVLTCGFAGGLVPTLPRGTVVHDSDPEAGLETVLAHAGSRSVRFLCLTRVAVTVAEKTELRRASGAEAVEMESGVIRQVCHEHRIPSATIRVISDAASDDLPVDFNQMMTSDMRLHFGRLAVSLLRSPTAITGLLRLRRQTVDAAHRLASALDTVCQCLLDPRNLP